MGTIRRFYDKLHAGNNGAPMSFSQSGEDRIIYFLTQFAGLKSPSYLDIGAYDPWFINNTALFYKQGCTGWNIEPNTNRFLILKKQRPKDVNLNIGIADHDGKAQFYEMHEETLSTFSKQEADRLLKEDKHQLKSEHSVPVMTIKTLIETVCKGKFPDILSLDVEGMDAVIISDMKQLTSLPSIICAETAIHTGGNIGPKNTALIESIKDLGFVQYADTFINTIFLRRELWK